MVHFLLSLMGTALLLCLTGCGSGGGDSGSGSGGDSPANAVNIKGITFDPQTSTQTDASLIGIPSSTFTTVQRVESLPNGSTVIPHTWHYTISYSVASDLEFSQIALPCTKMTVATTMDGGAAGITSYYLAKAISGDTYLLKKTLDSTLTHLVFDMTGRTGHPVLAAPKDPVVGSTCLFFLDPDAVSPDAIEPGLGGECIVAETNVTSPQGVTGCTRLQRKAYWTDLFVKPGVGIVYWKQIQFGCLTSQTRPGLVGPG